MMQAGPSHGEASVTASQLFRYAQDLEELMQQHSRLQQHYKMLLESLGKEVHSENLLGRKLSRSAEQHWVTDATGRILRMGEKKLRLSAQQPSARVGQDLLELLDPADRDLARQQLLRLAGKDNWAGLVHLRLRPLTTGFTPQGPAAPALDALLMRRQLAEHCEIEWFLCNASSDQDTLLQCQAALVRGLHTDHGVLLTTPPGQILAVNAGYCRISGFAEAELVGHNPRMLSSGRHDGRFFDDLYLELLDRGSWAGTLFNRRKSGQIYLQWQVIKMVEDADGKVVSYLAAMADLSYTEPPNRQRQPHPAQG